MAIRSCLSLSVAVLALAACGGEAPPEVRPSVQAQTVSSEECVPIADGMYEMRDGRLLATSLPPELAASNPALWAQEIKAGLQGAGIGWLGVVIRDQVAVVTGTAPDAEAKAQGFSTGRAAIEGHPRAGEANLIIVDGISIEGGEEGIGVPLANLTGQLTTIESCQAAFDVTSKDRVIQFGAGNANISPVSLPLIDALGGIAALCRAFEIEIGAHTDTRGADDYNQRVSQERADAIRAYLLGKELAEETLTAVGYGETQPIDTGSTAEAHARNRRTVFTVKQR
ncbi:ompA family protein [Hyphomonas neptunium ATCC 15444]|uniref:OmpA family protein n=2 Tax=Hyphomonas TaxID=85 RepID=Q0C3N1_HYPNA|nr:MULTISPECIES: OmpA family protein [Hyphomonas]ABI77702.1 ompA family protein [Hyphomonas neptunium ATCC 15444]KCZ96127.1 OmpA family protein [Hyphomonas hirschiana VP5]